MKRYQRITAVAAAALMSSPLFAVDYLVTRTDDPNPDSITLPSCQPSGGCSLRQAVLAANKRPGADRIVLSKNIYELTRTISGQVNPDGRSGALVVTERLDVVGASAALTRIRWPSGLTLPHQITPHQHQIWIVQQHTQLNLARITLSGGRGVSGGCIFLQRGQLALTDAIVERCETSSCGGALRVDGLSGFTTTVALTNVTMRGNQAQRGGAVCVEGESTFIGNGAVLENNTATSEGGAVYGSYGFANSFRQLALVWRSEGAGTRFSGNSAGRAGGAAWLVGAGNANFFAVNSGVPLLFENNLSLGGGGAISIEHWYAPEPQSPAPRTRLTVENAAFTGNSADRDGGAIAFDGADALITQSAFQNNVSQLGNGGAVSSGASLIAPTIRGTVEIRQSSFNENKSQQNGGAIDNQCQINTVRDSSFYANQSVQGQGEVISSTGSTFLAHVSTDAHGQTNIGPSTLHKSFNTACGAQPFGIANSVISGSDNCYGQAGIIQSNGGNQFGPSTGGCYFLAGLDQYGSSSTFGLSLGSFGGVKQVLGWNADALARPQVNFGQSVYCSAVDVRGLPRPASACDAGAFEQQ